MLEKSWAIRVDLFVLMCYAGIHLCRSLQIFYTVLLKNQNISLNNGDQKLLEAIYYFTFWRNFTRLVKEAARRALCI